MRAGARTVDSIRARLAHGMRCLHRIIGDGADLTTRHRGFVGNGGKPLGLDRGAGHATTAHAPAGRLAPCLQAPLDIATAVATEDVNGVAGRREDVRPDGAGTGMGAPPAASIVETSG